MAAITKDRRNAKTAQESPRKTPDAAQSNSEHHNAMLGLQRNPKAQAAENIRQALRVLDMVPRAASEYTPHPIDIVRAELHNVLRYLSIEESSNAN